MAGLKDPFGIQARGGCCRAGPYDHEAGQGCHGIGPGWPRIDFRSDAVRDHLVDAAELPARHGGKPLPDHTFEPGSGVWRHRSAVDDGPTGPPDESEALRWFPQPPARPPD